MTPGMQALARERKDITLRDILRWEEMQREVTMPWPPPLVRMRQGSFTKDYPNPPRREWAG